MPTGGTGPVMLTLSDGTSWTTAGGVFPAFAGPLAISGSCGSVTTAAFATGANGVVSLTGFQGNLPIPLQPTGDGSSATASNVTLFGRTDHTITVQITSNTGGTISAVNPAGGSCIAPFAVTSRNSCVLTVTAAGPPCAALVATTICLPCASTCPLNFAGQIFVAGHPTQVCTITATSAGTTCASCTGPGAVPPS
jgi:hypothetical protein